MKAVRAVRVCFVGPAGPKSGRASRRAAAQVVRPEALPEGQQRQLERAQAAAERAMRTADTEPEWWCARAARPAPPPRPARPPLPWRSPDAPPSPLRANGRKMYKLSEFFEGTRGKIRDLWRPVFQPWAQSGAAGGGGGVGVGGGAEAPGGGEAAEAFSPPRTARELAMARGGVAGPGPGSAGAKPQQRRYAPPTGTPLDLRTRGPPPGGLPPPQTRWNGGAAGGGGFAPPPPQQQQQRAGAPAGAQAFYGGPPPPPMPGGAYRQRGAPPPPGPGGAAAAGPSVPAAGGVYARIL